MSARQEPQAGGPPTFYANGVGILSQVYDFQLDFTLRSSPEAPAAITARVHLSPQLAKVLGRLLRQNVKAYQQQTGADIELPQALVNQLNIADLDE